MILLFLLACGAEPEVAGADTAPVDAPSPAPTTHLPTTTHPSLPHHDECLPPGEQMDDATCLAVVEADGRQPGQSFDRSWADPPDPDPRVDDADLAWLHDELRRCTCSCCHQSTLGGPGVYFWDLDFGPVWIDSASDWSLNVLAGTYPSENQFFPAETAERVRAVIEAELDRREESRERE